MMRCWNSTREIGRQAGVTLLETLIALAISSIVSGVLIMAIYQYGRTVRAQQDALLLDQQIQSASAVLNRDLVSADPSTVVISEDGDALSVQVRSYPFGSVAEPTVAEISYHLEEGALIRTLGDESVVISRHIQTILFEHTASTIRVEWSNRLRSQQRSGSLVVHLRPTAGVQAGP